MVPVSVYQFMPRRPDIFDELDEVRLLVAAETRAGAMLPAGARGTILAVWADGAAYEVEFDLGFATIEAGHLAAAD